MFHVAEYAGRPQQNRHMSVMTAGMHLTCRMRCKRKSGLFGNRQRIHISSQGNDRPRSLPTQRTDNGITAGNILLYLYTE